LGPSAAIPEPSIEKRYQGQPSGDGDVAGGCRAPREQPQQVAVQNEEEHREDERRELLPAVPDVGDGDVVADEQHQGFDGPAKTARRFALAVAARHLPAPPPDGDEDEQRRNHHVDDVLGGRDVDAEQVPTGGQVDLVQPQSEEAEIELEHVAVRRDG
jgi:hypothetical protein